MSNKDRAKLSVVTIVLSWMIMCIGFATHTGFLVVFAIVLMAVAGGYFGHFMDKLEDKKDEKEVSSEKVQDTLFIA